MVKLCNIHKKLAKSRQFFVQYQQNQSTSRVVDMGKGENNNAVGTGDYAENEPKYSLFCINDV